jgi:UPF0755 protein
MNKIKVYFNYFRDLIIKNLINSLLFFILIIILSLVFFTGLFGTPNNFPLNSIYTLEDGAGLNIIAEDLFNKGIIKSTFWFKTMSVLFGGSKGLKSGDYVLNKKQGVIGLAGRFTMGDYNMSLLKITIPEGLSVNEIGMLFAKDFKKIDSNNFAKLAKDKEGYLFPDTYLFLPNVEATGVISEMEETFNRRILELNSDIKNFNKPLDDIIKMASLVEAEARTMETRQIVAGILWQRLSMGMPLQVDSSFKYINGKTTQTLTVIDLKIDNPYNSYLYKGLPPTPICNPGLSSIKATITPIKTDYLFFLSDKNGNMHYARTYNEHLQNKQLYLK